METKYTPGPWEVVGNLVRSPMHQPRGLPKGALVADCRDSHAQPHTPEAKANARLIAAAPELLEILKTVAGEVTPGIRPTSADSHLPQNIVRAIHEVIFKATGEDYEQA